MIDLNLVGLLETVRVFLPTLLHSGRQDVADVMVIFSLGARVTFPATPSTAPRKRPSPTSPARGEPNWRLAASASPPSSLAHPQRPRRQPHTPRPADRASAKRSTAVASLSAGSLRE
jgi:hypothetical protein